MRAQDFIAMETTQSAEELIRQAQRMGDKSDWSPLELGRTARDQVAECALIAGSMVDVVKTFKMPEFSPEMMAEYERNKADLSLESAIDLLRNNTEKLVAQIVKVPDEKLEDMMQFWGPEPWKVVTVLGYHNWNLTYHIGQLNYIQTLYGDNSMG